MKSSHKRRSGARMRAAWKKARSLMARGTSRKAALRQAMSGRTRSNPVRHARHARRHAVRHVRRGWRMNPGAMAVTITKPAEWLPQVGWLSVGVVGTTMLPQLFRFPVAFQTGMGKLAVKSASAAGLGWVASTFVSKEAGKYVFLGGMATVAVDVLNQYVLPLLNRPSRPALPAGGVSAYLGHASARGGVGAYLGDTNAYLGAV